MMVKFADEVRHGLDKLLRLLRMDPMCRIQSHYFQTREKASHHRNVFIPGREKTINSFPEQLTDHESKLLIYLHKQKQAENGPSRRHICGSEIAKGLQSVKYSLLQYPHEKKN